MDARHKAGHDEFEEPRTLRGVTKDEATGPENDKTVHGRRAVSFERIKGMREIPDGAKGTCTLRVKPEHLANRYKDAMLPQVLATPVMVLIMENAALAAIRPYLDKGESAVGTAIDIRHLAATPVGHEVQAEAEVVKVEGKRIEFKVSAHDELEEIGRGTHQRMVIDLASFNERLARKSKG